MKNLIAYIDLLERRITCDDDSGDDISDDLDTTWRAMSATEREIANHVAQAMDKVSQ